MMFSCMVYSIKNCCIQAFRPIIFLVLCCFVIYLLAQRLCKNDVIRLSDENLEKALDDCLKTDKPDFAILITGSWGVGKTYFIKRYLRKKKESEGHLRSGICFSNETVFDQAKNAQELLEPELQKLFVNDQINQIFFCHA